MSGSIIELGLASTVLALLLAMSCIIFCLTGGIRERSAFIVVGHRALIANFALVTLACATVIWSFIQNDFSVAYVARNSNTHLPLVYRITAFWGAHEGSLLLWLWLLTLYSAAVAVLHHQSHPRSMPYVMATMAAIQVGFLILILFLSSPFEQTNPAPTEGRKLNPLLQDPGLIIHPPMLYLGYVGFSVPFAFAISALVRGRAGAEWVVAMRRWILFSWLCLTSGIMLGGYWAYYELGWGGYWAWDPVENAALMPWLTSTALLHSVMVQEKRNLFRGWNVFLAITTFALSLLGTFLVRSGVLTSVHAFAVDPTRGAYLLAFLAVVTLGGFGFLVMRADALRSDAKLEGSLSRESSLLFNNLFLLVAMATVFVGTLYPLAVEVIAGERITVAGPYFNKVVLPIMVAIVGLMALGPLLPWRMSTPARLRSTLKAPILIGLFAIAIGVALGVRDIVALAALAAVGIVLSSIALDLRRSVGARTAVTGESWLQGLSRLALWDRRRYGGLVVHIGVAMITIGIIGSGIFLQSKTVVLAPQDRFQIGGYTVAYSGIENVDGPNWTAREARLNVAYGSSNVAELTPQRRRYPRGAMTTTEAAILTTFSGDLYLVIGEELSGNRVSIRAYYIPLVSFIWSGWLVILLGSIFALSQRRSARTVASQSASAVAVQP